MALTRHIRLDSPVRSPVANRRRKWTLYNISIWSAIAFVEASVPYAAIRAATGEIAVAAEGVARSWSRQAVPTRGRKL